MGNQPNGKEAWGPVGKPKNIVTSLSHAFRHCQMGLPGQLLLERVATASKFLLFSQIIQNYSPWILSSNSCLIHYRAGFVKESGLGWWWQAGVSLEVLQSSFNRTFWYSAGWPPAPHSSLLTEKLLSYYLFFLPFSPYSFLFRLGILEWKEL